MPIPLVTAAVALALGASRPLVPAAAGSSPPTGQWRWPLAVVPVVARPFEQPPGPWAAGHRGVDLAAPPDTAVLAAGAGVVSFAGYVAGTGVVSVRHTGGLRTTYEPVLPAVRVGTVVSGGDLLGHLMPGHGDCGPARLCLHWGLLRGSAYLDPLTLLRLGPVRLLPLDDAAGRLASDDLPAAAANGRDSDQVGDAVSRGGVTRLPETGTPAASTHALNAVDGGGQRGGVTQFPETGKPAASTRSSGAGKGPAFAGWLLTGTGAAWLVGWWAARSPLATGTRRLTDIVVRHPGDRPRGGAVQGAT